MSPVTFIKRECRRHPRTYHLGECSLCATEKIRADLSAILARIAEGIRGAAA